MADLVILKSNGEKELFAQEKLTRSLRKSGASDDEIAQTVAYVIAKLKPNMSTGDIYALAYKNLNTHLKRNPNAIRYSLKRSVMELGPTGFPFEKFIARIFNALGYECKTGLILPGKCIEHEVDILAYNAEEVICMEAKFHNEAWTKSDAKVALYVKARFDDLIGQNIKLAGRDRTITKGILVTNTDFTDTVYQYVGCIGAFSLMSWSDPAEKNILNYIEKYSLYPIGVIPELSQKDIAMLVLKDILLCKELKNNPSVMDAVGFRKAKQQVILETINSICNC